MLLEYLITPAKAEKRPVNLIAVGFILTSVSIILSLLFFRADTRSPVAVFIAMVSVFPFVYSSIIRAERKEYLMGKGTLLLSEHWRTITVLFYLFIGSAVCFSIWYLILPLPCVQELFSSQTQTILKAGGSLPFGFKPIERIPLSSTDLFWAILIGNLCVLFFCLLFSFLYGAGAVLILMWNASIVGTAVGSLLRSGFNSSASVSLEILKYTIHGFPEAVAYLVAALAGGLLSQGIFHLKSEKRYVLELFSDTAKLTVISFILLIIAAFLESHVSVVI